MSMREELMKLRAENAKLLARRLTKIYTNEELAMLVDRESDFKSLIRGMKACEPKADPKPVVVDLAKSGLQYKPECIAPAAVVNPATMAAAMTQGW